MNYRVSVGILSWNRKDALRTALESVRRQTIFDEAEVVVVDNCSTDGSREMIRNEFPFVRLVERSENSGLAEGRNILVRLANAPVVFWMDDDCELVEDDCLEQLVREMEIHPQYAVVFARILEEVNGQSHLMHLFLPSDVLSPEPFEWVGTFPVTFASGGTCVRTRQFLKLGGYDGDFFRMGVENAFSYRVFNANEAIHYYPNVTIIHRPHSYGRNFRVINFYSTRNSLLGFWRYLPVPAAMVCTALELAAYFFHALRSPARMFGFMQGVAAFLLLIPSRVAGRRRPISRAGFSRWAYSKHYLIRSWDEYCSLPEHYSYFQFVRMELELGIRRRIGKPRVQPFLLL